MRVRSWCTLGPGTLKRARIRDLTIRLLLVLIMMVPLPVLAWVLDRQASGESMETLKSYVIASFILQWAGVLLTVKWMRTRQRPLPITRVARHTTLPNHPSGPYRGPGARACSPEVAVRHVDLGRYDCDLEPAWVQVRDKSTNGIWRLPRRRLEAQSCRRTSHKYYLAVASVFTFAVVVGAIFISQCLEITADQFTMLMVVALALMISPFLLRLLFPGFLVLVVYAALCGLHAALTGFWFYVPGQGVGQIFYAAGMIPYIVSRLFLSVWTENDVLLESEGAEVKLTLSESGFRRLTRALGMGSEV